MSAWYDGLTFEQVLSRVRESKEPLTVPQGFGAWFDAPPTTTEGSVPDPIDKLVDEIWESRNEPTRNEIEAELWRRLFAQLDRIEAGQGPRTLRQIQDHPRGIVIANVPTEASSHGTITIRSYNLDHYPAGHGFGAAAMNGLYQDVNSTEPTRSWQSALRQLADTLAPGHIIQFDQSNPEAACATIVEVVQRIMHRHETQVNKTQEGDLL